MDYIELFGIKWTPLTEEGKWLFVLVLAGAVVIAALAWAAPWLFDPWRGGKQ